MAWMLEDMPVEEMAASSHPLLGFSTAVMTDYDGMAFSFVNWYLDHQLNSFRASVRRSEL